LGREVADQTMSVRPVTDDPIAPRAICAIQPDAEAADTGEKFRYAQ